MTSLPARYPEIEVSGSPRTMGQQIGEAAGEAVRGFCQVALEHINRSVKVSPQLADAVVRDSLTHARRYAPEMVEEPVLDCPDNGRFQGGLDDPGKRGEDFGSKIGSPMPSQINVEPIEPNIH